MITVFKIFIWGGRANPGSEFVVANTLAKWKKLEPNEIGFSQKVVSTSCLVFKYGTLLKCEGIKNAILENPKC